MFSTWVRRIATGILLVVGAIFTGVVFPVVSHFIQEQPQETANVFWVVLKFLSDLSEQAWLRITVSLLVGFVAGLWVDWLLRRLDGSRAKQREALGTEMRILGHDLNLFGARPQITSCFIAARKLGLWVPDQHIFTLHVDFAEPLIKDYLLNVGTMLKDGHFREAKQYAAVNSKARFDKAYAQFRLRDRPIT
jgi:hypothetical protein